MEAEREGGGKKAKPNGTSEKGGEGFKTVLASSSVVQRGNFIAGREGGREEDGRTRERDRRGVKGGI